MRCDSHVHIVGAADRYPFAPERNYLPGVATLDTLLQRAAARGIARFVIVQPSFYGADNSLLLESLDRLGERGRGVAVADPSVAPATLANWAARGVRGLRVNLYSVPGKSAPLDAAFAPMANIARTMQWHVEVIAPLNVLAAHAEVIAGAPVPVVIDHYGLYGHRGTVSAEGRRLLNLLRLPHVWIKLSAPYRVSDHALETRPDPAWLAAILAAAKERCVWGSDWPHTPSHQAQKGATIPAPYRELSYETLLDHFISALGADELAERILQHNPARLYGFSDSD